jgi:hypothetical protein
MKTNRSLTNSFSNPKEKVSNLKVFFKKLADKILHLNRHEIAPDGRQQGDGKIGFSTLKSPHSSRKSIKIIFGNHDQYFILTSFIESN